MMYSTLTSLQIQFLFLGNDLVSHYVPFIYLKSSWNRVKVVSPRTKFIFKNLWTKEFTVFFPNLQWSTYSYTESLSDKKHLSRWQWQGILEMNTAEQGQSLLYLNISLSQFRQKGKVPASRQPWKQNKQACKWDVFWMWVYIYWQEGQWNLWLYFLILYSFSCPTWCQRSYF